MKLAVFGDVHGNHFALKAVVRDIEAHQLDVWVNLGDQLFGGADPLGAWQTQQQLKARYGVHEVRGNTDERLGEKITPGTKKREMLEWLHSVLPASAGEYVANLPISLSLASGEVIAAHGTPSDPWEYLLRNEKTWATDEQVLKRLGDTGPARVVIVGHSHLEQVRQLGNLTVVNCGAVSRQKDGSALARWALLEGGNGIWNVTFKRVHYDIEAAAKWAEEHAHDGRKEARQLRTGRDQ